MEHQHYSKQSSSDDSVLPASSSLWTDIEFTRYCSALLNPEDVGYRTIGFGQCGVVFERSGRGFVLKVAKPSYKDSLWADFKAHFNVRQAFEQQGKEKLIECRVPRLYSYVAKDNDKWWNESHPLFSTTHESVSLPAMTLISQRILPLPKIARDILINKYCPDTARDFAAKSPTNRDCLARVYLGRRRLTNTLSGSETSTFT